MIKEKKPACRITVTCNNVCNPLEKTGAGDHVRYPMSLMRKLLGEHGLAYHVDLGKEAIVFDTGGMLGTFIKNIQHVDPRYWRIDTIALSHGHHDHVGGLVPFLALSRGKRESRGESEMKTRVACHPSALARRYRVLDTSEVPTTNGLSLEEIHALEERGVVKSAMGIVREEVNDNGGSIDVNNEPVVLCHDQDTGTRVSLTGEIPRIHEKEFLPDYYLIQEEDGTVVKDVFRDDQAMVIERGDEYCIVLLGCCHAGIENTIAQVKRITTLPIKAITGGFHLVGAGRDTLERKLDFLEEIAAEMRQDLGKDEKLIVRPTHCSGEAFYILLKTHGSSHLDVHELPVGTVLEF